MSDIADQIQEASEHASESKLNGFIALFVALSATFMALCNVKDGNIVQAMSQAQVKAASQWSFYQAKSTKQHIAENAALMLKIQEEITPGLSDGSKAMLAQKVKGFEGDAKRYANEKETIKADAEHLEKSYDELNVHDDQFDMAEACLSVSIALFGITALTKKKKLFVVACIFSTFGFILGLAGFLKWNLHPDWLAKLLG